MERTNVTNGRPPLRYLHLSELLGYVTGWGLLGACFTLNHDVAWQSSVALVGLFALPGILIVGGIGFLVGGRRRFLPAALIGLALWILCNLVPQLYGGSA